MKRPASDEPFLQYAIYSNLCFRCTTAHFAQLESITVTCPGCVENSRTYQIWKRPTDALAMLRKIKCCSHRRGFLTEFDGWILWKLKVETEINKFLKLYMIDYNFIESLEWFWNVVIFVN